MTGNHSSSKTKTKTLTEKSKRDVDPLSNVDYAPTDTHSSQGESQLYIFEDNEALIKMIIKGRSPMMKHMSRTHRVALAWLFDRINLDPKVQIKKIDTKTQLADLLTKSSFTRDDWCNLLGLVDIIAGNCNSVFMIMLCMREEVAGNFNGAMPKAPCLTVLKEPRETAGRTKSMATCPRVQRVAGNCNEN